MVGGLHYHSMPMFYSNSEELGSLLEIMLFVRQVRSIWNFIHDDPLPHPLKTICIGKDILLAILIFKCCNTLEI